jgi:hypothetical protein
VRRDIQPKAGCPYNPKLKFMCRISKSFFSGLLVFILSFFCLSHNQLSQTIAGELRSEFDLSGFKNTEVIMDDFLVNDDTTSILAQYTPAVAGNSSGSFIITWRDCRNDFSGDIYAQRYNSSGLPIDSNFKVNNDAGYAFQSNPSVTMNDSGNFILTWEDHRLGGSDIFAQSFNSSRLPIGYNFKVNDDAGAFEQFSPSIAMDGSGNFFICWTDYRNGNADIYVQRYNSAGISLGDNFKVNDDSGITYQETPAVSVDGYGNFILVWQDYRNREWNIYAQIYNSLGNPVGGNFKVNDDPGNSYQKSPDIAAGLSGNFVITWRDERNGNSDIYAQRYNFSGNPLNSDFKVNDDPGFTYQGYPAICMDLSDNFYITWNDYRNGNRDIYAQRYDSSGIPIGSNFKVNDDSGDAFQEYPDIAINDSGNFVLTWQDLRQGNYDIYAQRFDLTGAPEGSNFLVNKDYSVNEQGYPDMTVDNQGNFALVWQDYRKGNWDIYVQRYNSSGMPLSFNLKANDDTTEANQKYPSISMDDSGNLISTWQDYRNGNWGIYAQRFNSSGIPLGPDFRVDSLGGISPVVDVDGAGNFVITWTNGRVNAQRFDTSGTPIDTNFRVSGYGGSNPDIALHNLGNFVITWEDYRNDRYKPDIYARRYDSQANPLDSTFRVNDDTGITYQGDPAISMDNSGNFIITWRDERNGNWDIYAQRYDFSGNPLGSNFKVNDDPGNHNQWSPDVVMTSSGGFVITWHDYRNNNPDIYAQRYDFSGVPLGNNYLVNNPHFASFDQTTPAIASSGSDIYFAWMDNRKGNLDIFAKVVDWSYTEVEEEQIAELPNYFGLYQNYPNPFNPTTKIQFKVGSLEFGEPLRTSLVIYNILGQKVRTLLDEEILPGGHQVIWDGKDEKGRTVSSGIYFYRLKAGGFTETKRMVFLK